MYDLPPPKWIIEFDKVTGDYTFVLGRTNRHKQLCFTVTDCIGGGYWVMNKSGKELWLHGSSEDFGQCNITAVTQAIATCDFFQVKFSDFTVYFTQMTYHRDAIELDKYTKIYPK